MRKLSLIKNNDKALIMKLFNSKNEEINLSTFTFQEIRLKGKQYNSITSGDFVIDKLGVFYTDDAGDTWIKFQFLSEDFETLLLTEYICEIIIELLPGRFINAFIEKGSDHRFIIEIKDSFI